MGTVTRRDFIEVCAATVATAALSEPQPKPTRVCVCLAESGFSTRQDGVCFVVGCLVSSDPAKHRAGLIALKKATKFERGEFKFGGASRHKMLYASAMMRYFAREPELRFAARIVQNVARPLAYQKVAGEYERVVLDARIPSDALVRLRKRPTRGPESGGYRLGNSHESARLRIARNAIKDVATVPRSAKDPLLELASALTGSLFTAVAPGGPSTALKASIETRLRTLLAVESLRSVKDGKWEPRTPTA